MEGGLEGKWRLPRSEIQMIIGREGNSKQDTLDSENLKRSWKIMLHNVLDLLNGTPAGLYLDGLWTNGNICESCFHSKDAASTLILFLHDRLPLVTISHNSQ